MFWMARSLHLVSLEKKNKKKQCNGEFETSNYTAVGQKNNVKTSRGSEKPHLRKRKPIIGFLNRSLSLLSRKRRNTKPNQSGLKELNLTIQPKKTKAAKPKKTVAKLHCVARRNLQAKTPRRIVFDWSLTSWSEVGVGVLLRCV